MSEAAMPAPAPNGDLSVRIRKSFSGESATSFALDVDFTAAAGFTILFGASGAGKTTLLDCIAGLQKPGAGKIAAGDCVLFSSADGLNLPPNRRAVGYLLQTLALFPHMTVSQNVRYGLDGLPEDQREDRCGRNSGAISHLRALWAAS